ncbi:hypothetical protein HN873_043911 [Arachis hypogaea]
MSPISPQTHFRILPRSTTLTRCRRRPLSDRQTPRPLNLPSSNPLVGILSFAGHMGLSLSRRHCDGDPSKLVPI